MSKKLTPKQQLFIAAYEGNGTDAARKAGYKGDDNTLAQMAAENLRKPYIAEAIDAKQKKQLKKLEISGEKVLKRLDDIGAMDIGEIFDEQGRLKPIHEIPEEVRRCISSIKVFEEFEGFGKDRIQIGVVREIKFWDKVKANELLGKNQKLFTEKVEHSGAITLEALVAGSNEEIED